MNAAEWRREGRSRTRRSWWRAPGCALAGLLMLVLCSCVSRPLLAQEPTETSTEYQIKAAYLFNFARFIEWPAAAFESPESPIVVGVLGESPFGDDLEQIIAGTTAGGRTLLIRRLETVNEAASCQILFISSSEFKQLGKILQRLEGRHLLTVGEAEGFAEQGGVIQFSIEANRVRFAVNLDSANEAELRISSKLLRLATTVYHATVRTE